MRIIPLNTYVPIFANASIVMILFFGGAASIIWSINIRKYDILTYDVNTTGLVTFISPLALAFTYSYSHERIEYFGTWLPTNPFVNTTTIVVTYASAIPRCSLVPMVPGLQEYDTCGPIMGSPWFWPMLMTFGMISMISSVAVFKFSLCLY